MKRWNELGAWIRQGVLVVAVAAGCVSAGAVQAATCSVTTPPTPSTLQRAQERLLWGSWASFEERNIELGYAGGRTMRYHALLKTRTPGVRDASRPLVLMLHGYPEFSWAWERWIPVVGEQHDVLAIDLKGHGLSSKPLEIDEYTITRLTAELHDLIGCMGYTEVIPVGHDFGGALAWSYAIFHPQRTRAVVVLSTPHPYPFYRELAQPDSDQRQRSRYVDLVRENTPQSMLQYFVGLSQDTSLFGEFYRWPRVNRLIALNMSSADKWNAMLGFYRAMDYPPSPLLYPKQPTFLHKAIFTVRAPTLAFYGTADPYFSPDSWQGVQDFVPQLDFRPLEGQGHFIHHDVPGLAEQVRDFIALHSP